MVDKQVIAIIIARGGSTRVPKKNIIDFFGKPIIAYTIEACIKARLFDRIIVSTDNEEISAISRQFGAEVPFLRTSYADSFSTSSEATLFALSQAEEYYQENYHLVAQLMPNCPIRDENDIQNAMYNFKNKSYKSQITCFKFGYMNPWWALKLNDNFEGKKIITQINTDVRSQDLDDLYCPTGAIWITKAQYLKQNKNFYGEHNYFELNWKNSVDIDTYEDLEMAKAVYMMMQSKTSR